MSEIKCNVQQIFIKPHPNADALELANIGSTEGWQCVVKKGQYKTGDYVVYIPENAVVPEDILKYYNFWNNEKNKGLLSGSLGDRVKAVKLRGEFSLGITIPLEQVDTTNCFILKTPTTNYAVVKYENVTKLLGITKYEPKIPVNLAGEVFNAGSHVTIKYDIENSKNYPNVFNEGELVQVTSKLHGTFCGISFLPKESLFVHEEMIRVENGYISVFSKGLGAKGLCFKDNEANTNNLYLKTVKPLIDEISKHCTEHTIIMGEIFGDVQDLKYGAKQNETMFRVFDVWSRDRFLSHTELNEWLSTLPNVTRVPVLYEGPFQWDIIEPLFQHAKETEFDPKQIREGVVIKPQVEREDSSLGRVVLKFINEDYYLRKNGSELN